MREASCTRTLAGTAMLVLLAAVPLRAQFVGTMTFATHARQGDGTLTEIVRGSKTRYDFSGGGAGGMSGAMIYDSVTKTRTMLLPARKQYLTVTGDPAHNPTDSKGDITWTLSLI